MRAARNRLGLSQVQLAQAAGLSLDTYLKVEHGYNTRPRIDTLLKIARALNVSLLDLLFEPPWPALPEPIPVSEAVEERMGNEGTPTPEPGPLQLTLTPDTLRMLADPDVHFLLAQYQHLSKRQKAALQRIIDNMLASQSTVKEQPY